MIRINGQIIEQNCFPDGTARLQMPDDRKLDTEVISVEWAYDNDGELFALMAVTDHLKSNSYRRMELHLPYIPHARMDRCELPQDVFTLKTFARILNGIGFEKVKVLEAHSHVSLALIDRICNENCKAMVDEVMKEIARKNEMNSSDVLLFFPDAGASKRYAGLFANRSCYGSKNRDWETGKITGLNIVTPDKEFVKDKVVLIVDDISSRGGTFYHSAKELKKMGAGKIYLYISHCENTILEGELIQSEDVERIYTTDSIFTKKHEKIEVFARYRK